MIEGVTTIRGPKDGKTVSVIGGIHGNEKCGIGVIEDLVPKIKIETGKVHFIYGNPLAISRQVRQVEFNLNRAFRPENELSDKELSSYERQRAVALMPLLEESDAVLDLHSSLSKTSVPFIICAPRSFEVAKQLSFPIISCGWDKLEPGGTDDFMNRLGKIGLCAECGYHLNPSSTARAKQTTIDFLGLMGVMKDNLPSSSEHKPKIVGVHFIYHTKTNFLPVREFADFEQLKKDELIGRDGNEQVLAPAADYIVFCRKRERPFEEAFLLGREIVS